MNLCFQVVIVAGNTDKRGKVINIFPADDVGTLAGGVYTFNESITSPRTGFIFVTNAPANVITKRFLEPIYSDDGDFLYEIPFKFDGITQQLLDDRQITMPWGLFLAALVSSEHGRPAILEDLI